MGVLIACDPVELTIYESESKSAGSGGSSPVDPVYYGLGGTSAAPGETEDPSGTGGKPTEPTPGPTPAPVVEYVLDDFEDGDTKGIAPAGWWYPVNDSTGAQLLGVVAVEEDTEAPGGRSGHALRNDSGEFSDWGSAWGVDIGDYNFPEGGFEVSFSLAASRPVEVSFHALDGSKHHFTREVEATTSWSRVTVRLDNLFVVEESTVLRFDETTAHELQWFVFDETPVIVWLDDVTMRTF